MRSLSVFVYHAELNWTLVEIACAISARLPGGQYDPELYFDHVGNPITKICNHENLPL